MCSRSFALFLLSVFVVCSCGSSAKLRRIRRHAPAADLRMAEDRRPPVSFQDTTPVHRDTIVVKGLEGEELILMHAVRDEDGEMVATDRIDAAVVSARFRNVAERLGRVDVEFDIVLPAQMQDRNWQITFYPVMTILNDTLRLDPVQITGSSFKRSQMRAYQMYERFLERIARDSLLMIDRRSLEIFISRNFPEIYKHRNDTSVVDESMIGLFGVTEQEVRDHYTRKLTLMANRIRVSRKERRFRRFVKTPVLDGPLKLDTVLTETGGNIIYRYHQSVMTRPSMKKIDLVLSGNISEFGKKIYDIPPSEPLSFYVSSLSSLLDRYERYRTEIVDRMVKTTSACYIEFASGSSRIDGNLGNNSEEMGRITENIRELVYNPDLILDSVVVTAYASPEGSVSMNALLCHGRAESASVFFSNYLQSVRDSLYEVMGEPPYDTVRFIAGRGGENWTMLGKLVADDVNLSEGDKLDYSQIAESAKEADARERRLFARPYYRYLREKLYPRLRVVRFEFFLSRKGMLKDTVHTTVLDSVYMRGLDLLAERRYEEAFIMLRDYCDYNTAVACLAADRNTLALEILSKLEKTARVCYLEALALSRKGDEKSAVRRYMEACRLDRSFIFRGSLDPEIALLIRKYNLKSYYD